MKTIVLIDDTQVNLSLLRYLVKKFDSYESMSFLNPVEGLDWCLHNDYELVIVDYTMPNINGVEFIEQLKSVPEKSEIPILMITANSELDIRYRALEAGASDFLNKPIDKTEFMIRVKNMLLLCENQKKVADKSEWLANEVQKATVEIRNREEELISRLSKAAEYRDPETGNHIKRTAYYSKHIAKQLGLSLAEQNLIAQATPMHDIGKVGISDAILLKPSKLTESEYTLMKQHVYIGHKILANSESRLMQVGSIVALQHHEKYDGSGYPQGLEGKCISIYGRIVAVADVFDALTSSRPYKAAWSFDEAINFLKKNSGSHFDPLCVEAFLKDWNNILDIHQRFCEE